MTPELRRPRFQAGWGRTWLDDLAQDLRYGARLLARSPGFALAAVLILALGIGAVTAVFSVINVVLLQPIVVDQERVVRVWPQDPERDGAVGAFSHSEIMAWREQASGFEGLAAIVQGDSQSAAVVVDGRAVGITVTPVSADFFAITGMGPLYGRWLRERDEDPSAALAAVVSHRFWQRASGGDPAFLGRSLSLAGDTRTVVVVGVAPPDLDYPLATDVWVPVTALFGPNGLDASLEWTEESQILHAIGRLAPAVSLAQARAELAVLHRRFVEDNPTPLDGDVMVEPLLDTVVGNARQLLLWLFAAAGLVFAAAGANVAALMVMRASQRRRELAVRAALGAGRARLLRLTVTEAALLGLLGAAGGLLVTSLLLWLIRWIEPGEIPRIQDVAVAPPVLAFCTLVLIAWVVGLGALPAWGLRSTERSLSQMFRSAPQSGGRKRSSVHSALVTAEIALALLVSIGAVLLVQSFARLSRIDRGFDSTNLAAISMTLPGGKYPDAASRLAFYEELLPDITAIPGIVSATPVELGPGTGGLGLSALYVFEGQTLDEAATNPFSTFEGVTPSYFRTLGIPIVRGRGFSDADTSTAAPVAIVSEAVARRHWPGENPVGKQLKFIPDFPWATVVGVAGEVRYRQLTRPWPAVYFPASQFFFFSPGLLAVRTTTDPETLLPVIRDRIRAREPDLALDRTSTMEALLAGELSRPRAALTVSMLFAIAAVILAGIGVYGTVTYEVSQRRYELAIRSAIGASPAQIRDAVIRRGAALALVGIGAGMAGALATTRLMTALLFEVTPTDARAFLVGAGVLLAITLLASYIPSRRAAKADPLTALRCE